MELQARHRKLIERRSATRSEALWDAHRGQAHSMRSRGAHQ